MIGTHRDLRFDLIIAHRILTELWLAGCISTGTWLWKAVDVEYRSIMPDTNKNYSGASQASFNYFAADTYIV